MKTFQDVNSLKCLQQPSRDTPFLPREWVQMYHKIEITRESDGAAIIVPCTSANFFLMDLNPVWYVDQLVKSGGNTLFILYLDTTNSCTDKCPMCFTALTRGLEGFQQSLQVDLALKRIKELRIRYPSTFRMVSLAGPGEPLNHKDIHTLIKGAHDLGSAVRVYTAGKRLIDATIRRTLLDYTKLIRVSIDASKEETYQRTHGVKGLKERLVGIEKMVEEKVRCSNDTLIGMHFVIQKANMNEIVSFATLAKNLGADFVVYSQETFGKVNGGFSKDDFEKVVHDLKTVEMMHSYEFRTVVPHLVQRQTYTEFDKTYYSTPDVLNNCHNSKHRLFFGVQNDFSACWLATLDAKFRRESFIGMLDKDDTMTSLYNVVENGVGSELTDGAELSCKTCVAGNYNSMINQISHFLNNETHYTTRLIEHAPGTHTDSNYKFILKN
ncbi:radical SAM protein [Salipaludibacillus agaradhaerens]|jgi:wyosine [tRNA(Phe)-imidazoG37] synthetase (radical SAM superfamily)|uniref:radical SAM protein n=1 Tax=Salipaludibacillus agaradhaerens TaxID=76935 RepID=UPI00215137A7|nr:radical SAM protein [Salipaludibacillus agaradhaerens]MCR6106775.1 radical SAM protein [Salipaludibacillus agaradhaerens]MCR6118807.1 radical SAM protein [Salipaludibacillus agaradhaerens]UJW57883.1 radical SAM protein [Bacillus sp. A116_S68]